MLLARGFIGQPKALIMENVLSYVDPQIKEKVVDYIMKGSWTLLIVSNDETVQKMADEVIYMENGRLIFQGSFEEYKKIKK